MEFLSAAGNRETFFKEISLFLPTLDYRYVLIERAYNYAKDAFRGKKREGGERYFEHLRAVTLILLIHLRVRKYRLTIDSLFHDIVEDCPEWPIERVQKEFGKKVAVIVEYLSKPKGYPNKQIRDEIYHRRFEFAPRDFFLIKLSDRYHNLITLDYCETEKRIRKIKETREHYLPYAKKHQILYHEILDALEQLERI